MSQVWNILINGQLRGPFSVSQLMQMVNSNQVSPNSSAQSCKTGDYYMVRDILKMYSEDDGMNPNSYSQPAEGYGVQSQPVQPGQYQANSFQAPPVAQPQPVQPGQYQANPFQAPPAAQPQPVQPDQYQVNPFQAPPAAQPQPIPPTQYQANPFQAPPAAQPQPVQPGQYQANPFQAPPAAQPQPVQPGQYQANPFQAPPAVSRLQSLPILEPVGVDESGQDRFGRPVSPLRQAPGVFNGSESVPPPISYEGQGMASLRPTAQPSRTNGATVTMRDWTSRANSGNGDIVCPHCWGHCSLETMLFISSHPELMGDSLLGKDAPLRFLPKYFTEKGTSFDARGVECTDMACPYCHLKIPSATIDLSSIFYSIVGAPASGKSYFLTSMIWQLRTCLPQLFNFSFFDTDPSFNTVLNNYERILFLNPEKQEYVSLPKTELQGKDFSNQIVIENNSIELPRPFMFTLSPLPTHPYYDTKKAELEKGIVLYDNAGEHFETGRDSSTNLATVHLVESDGIMFLYDPLKDIRLRQGCSEEDPQIAKNVANITNQMTIFTEMISRVHRYSNLKANETYDKPLIMVIPKYDAWRDSFPLEIDELELILRDETGGRYLNMDAVCAVSFCLRQYLMEVVPEIVGLAEGFSSCVYFVPVSALGRMPEFDSERSLIGIKPDHIAPIWAEVPALLLMHLKGLLRTAHLEDDGIPFVSSYYFTNGYIVFSFPGDNEQYTLQSFYCGKTVFCAKSMKYYRLPEYPQEEEASKVEPDVLEGVDMGFWSN